LVQSRGVNECILRRYFEMGTKAAWLAERALSYEQDRSISLIGFDYFPMQFQGISGADLLQADLATLEASRLENLKETLSIKHTVSLARDFPLEFGQMKKRGKCIFRTEELPFRYAFPGTYGYRIRAITVTANSLLKNEPIRGLLKNRGFSSISRSNGESRTITRPPSASPISEFRLRDDMAVFELPGETLMPFEGSGIDSFWELEFPIISNPYGRESV
jgi:hypothetical protein